MTTYLVRLTCFSLVFGLQSMVALAGAQSIEVPAVPTDIQAPAGQEVFFSGHAIGTQNFICLATSAGVTWRFTGPQATLFVAADGDVSQITTHFLSGNPGEHGLPRPAWQHSSDTSAVWGRLRASSNRPDYVAPGAIPWLLLEVAGARLGPTGGDLLATATFIHRVNTTGGLAPTTGCTKRADVGAVALVPYTADYFFYKPAP
jgi:hypothetical protein